MTTVWITDAFLSFVSFTCAIKLWPVKTASARLAAAALLMLSAASMLGMIRYGLQPDSGNWEVLHYYASRFFGVVGLYMLFFVWLDVAGVLRIRLPLAWAHIGDGMLIFLIGYWLNKLDSFQLYIGIGMTLAALVAAVLFFRQRMPVNAFAIATLAGVFVINGLVIGGSLEPFIGPLMRIDAFHLIFALWAWGLTAILRQKPSV